MLSVPNYRLKRFAQRIANWGYSHAERNATTRTPQHAQYINTERATNHICDQCTRTAHTTEQTYHTEQPAGKQYIATKNRLKILRVQLIVIAY